MRALAFVCCLAACGGGQSPGMPDATTTDGVVVDGPCGGGLFVTGELLDLESSDAQFQGVADATLTLQGMPQITLTTPPNGRIEICVPAARSIVFDVEASADHLDGAMYIEAEALRGAVPLSLRSYTAAQAATLYTFDATKAHVLVFLAGDRSGVTLDRAHDAPLGGNAEAGAVTLTAGGGGRYILFPNVEATGPTATLTGDTSGPHTIPIAAGTLTLAAIFFVFL